MMRQGAIALNLIQARIFDDGQHSFLTVYLMMFQCHAEIGEGDDDGDG